MSEHLSAVQDSDVNFYVIVPFTTVAAAEWAAGEVGCLFDCHVISAASVDPSALVVASVTYDDDLLPVAARNTT